MIIAAGSETGTPATIYFDPSIDIQGYTKIGLLRFSLHNSWFNITMENNVLRYWDSKGWKTKILRPGNYNIDTLSNSIKLGDNVKIKRIEYTGHTYIAIQNNYKIDFTHPRNFASLLGFDNKILTTSQTSPRRASFLTVSEYRIHCNLIDTSKTRLTKSGNATARPSNFLEILPLREHHPLYEKVVYENKNCMLPMPLSKDNNISYIKIWVTDQYNQPVDFNGWPFTFIVELY